jgi:hypothetical protein
MPESQRVTREELYDRVWSTPMIQLAAEFGISDVGLAKICKRLNVPVPHRGYWARIKAGIKIPRLPLPSIAKATFAFIAPTPSKPEETDDEIRARQAREALVFRFSAVTVPGIIESPHALTKRTLKYYERIRSHLAKPKRPRLGEVNFDVFRFHEDKGRYFCGADEGFDMVVSLEQLDRALRILDTLAKTLEREKFRFQVGQDKKILEAQKDAEGIRLSVREGYTRRMLSPAELGAKRAEYSWARENEMVGSGKLILTISGRERGTEEKWSDGKISLEARLPHIIATFVELIPKQKELRESRAKIAAEEAARERVLAKERWREDQERRDFAALLAEAGQREALLRLGPYLDEIERGIIEANGELPGHCADWLKKMRARLAASAHDRQQNYWVRRAWS